MDNKGFHVIKKDENGEDLVGFKLFFKNGYGISVVFGDLADCSDVTVKKSQNIYHYQCKNAEVAVINSNGEIVPFAGEGTIKSKTIPDDIPQIISWAMKK